MGVPNVVLPKSQSYNFTSNLGVKYWDESLIAQRGREMTQLIHPLLSCSSFLLDYFNKNSSNKTILPTTSCAFLSDFLNPSYTLFFFPPVSWSPIRLNQVHHSGSFSSKMSPGCVNLINNQYMPEHLKV